jgi:hypothetical protein
VCFTLAHHLGAVVGVIGVGGECDAELIVRWDAQASPRHAGARVPTVAAGGVAASVGAAGAARKGGEGGREGGKTEVGM